MRDYVWPGMWDLPELCLKIPTAYCNNTQESQTHLLKKVEYDNDIKSDQEQLIYFQSLWAPLLSTAYLCAFKGSILTETKTLKWLICKSICHTKRNSQAKCTGDLTFLACHWHVAKLMTWYSNEHRKASGIFLWINKFTDFYYFFFNEVWHTEYENHIIFYLSLAVLMTTNKLWLTL